MCKPVCIFGAGESAKSVYQLICSMGHADDVVGFIETNQKYRKRQVYGVDVQPGSFFDASKHKALLAIGMPAARASVAKQLPADTEFASYIHPGAFMLSPSELNLGPGTIVFPQVYFSRNINIGAHAIIMTGTVIGHDINIGDFLTTSANVSFGGGVTLGREVFCGLGAAIRDHTSVCDKVIIGMSAAVAGNIERPGAYIGNPAKRMAEQPSTTTINETNARLLTVQ